MNTPTPAHVALVAAHFSAVFNYANDYDEDHAHYHVEAAQAILDALALAQPALAAPVLNDDQKRKLITNYFEETRDVNAAMHLLHDYHRLIAQRPTPAASPELASQFVAPKIQSLLFMQEEK